jgi:hypothetical protein
MHVFSRSRPSALRRICRGVLEKGRSRARYGDLLCRVVHDDGKLMAMKHRDAAG